MERHTVIYSGTVQGVGFRWRAARAVEGLAVTGFVRNESDGTVRLVLEGNADDLRAARARIRSALDALIRGEEERIGAASGEFDGFSIRR
jgi:acylphosphatase